jgi:CRP-like cAMP-binding protein
MAARNKVCAPDLFNAIDAHFNTDDYRNKQAIFAQGDKAGAFCYILDGHVKLTVRIRERRESCHHHSAGEQFIG